MNWFNFSHTLLSFFYICLSVSGQSSEDSKEENSNNEPNWYAIYDAIESMRSLTDYRTFYDFFELPPTATDNQLSRAFKKLSAKFHPDKAQFNKEMDEKKYLRMGELVMFVGSLFRSKNGRKNYDFILNEAPAWHRQTHYSIRKLVPASRLSMKQFTIIVFGSSILIPYLIEWILFGIYCGSIIWSRRLLKGMGDKEVKRLRKRMVNADLNFLSTSNSAYYTVMLADSEFPTYPSIFDVWFFAVPRDIFRYFSRKSLSESNQKSE